METIDPANLSHRKLIDTALGKLHIWRLLIPVYHEMVSETLQLVLSFSCSKLNRAYHLSGESSTASCPLCTLSTASMQALEIKAYGEDFKMVLRRLEECQSRIDRLTSVVTAVMAVEDTRRAIKDARNIGFLTWLATFFIPFGVLSGVFSMQKLKDMSTNTFRLYFAVTLPVAFVTLLIAWTLHSSIAHKWFSHI